MTSYFNHDVIEMTNFDRKSTQTVRTVILTPIKTILKQQSVLSIFWPYDYQLILGVPVRTRAEFFRDGHVAYCASNKP